MSILKPFDITSAGACCRNRHGRKRRVTVNFHLIRQNGCASSNELRNWGFSLEEVGELLALRIEPEQNRADVRARAEAKITDIESKMKTLAAMKKTLRGLVDQCEQCGSAECPILASLENSTQ